MSGLGVFLWLAIGAAGGWVVSRLMVSAGDDALRGTAAGMIGAILGGLGIRLLEWAPGLVSNDLNSSVAALAGSLWLTWITCVVTSGRERAPALPASGARVAPQDAASAASHLAAGRPRLTYAAARDQLVDQLLRDAMAHETGRYEEVGRSFDSVERALPHGTAPELGKLRVAAAFWDGWIEARNGGWRPGGGIGKTEWPLLARSVAADLEGDRDVTDWRVVTHFDVGRYPSLGTRVQALAARMRAS